MWRICGWLLFASSAGDVASTELALTRPGIVELNTFQRDRIVRVTTHVAAPLAAWWLTEKLRELSPAAGWIVRVAVVVAYSYITVRNLHNWRPPS